MRKLFAVLAVALASTAFAGITVDQGSGSASVKPWSVVLTPASGGPGGATTTVFNALPAMMAHASLPVNTQGVKTISGMATISGFIGANNFTYKLQCSDDATIVTTSPWAAITGATIAFAPTTFMTGGIIPTTTINCKWVRAIFDFTSNERQQITTIADVGGSLTGRYLLVSGSQTGFPAIAVNPANVHYAYWLRVAGAGASPGTFAAPSTPDTTVFPTAYYTPVAVNVATNDTAATVATALGTALNSTRAAFLTSTDNGATWIPRAGTFPATDNTASPLVFGNGQFVTVKNGAAMQSTDGINWTTNTAGTPNVTINQVIWVGAPISLYVAVGGTAAANNVWTSPDGITWTVQTSSGAFALNTVCFNGTEIVAMGAGAAAVTQSIDGINWAVPTLQPPSATYTACAWNGSIFAAVVGSGTTAASSADGLTWASRTQITGAWGAIAAQPGGRFVSTQFNSSTFQTSEDGITWVSRVMTPIAPGGGAAADMRVDSLIWDANSSAFWLATFNPGTFPRAADGIAWSTTSGTPYVGNIIGHMAVNGAGTIVVMRADATATGFVAAGTVAVGSTVTITESGGSQIPLNAGTSGFTVAPIFPPLSATVTATIITQP